MYLIAERGKGVWCGEMRSGEGLAAKPQVASVWEKPFNDLTHLAVGQQTALE